MIGKRTMSTKPSLEAVNLSKRYGSFTALSDLNLKIEGSKCVGFLGPNGAGKTTTLKIFCDMIRATSGSAYLNGFEIREDKKRALESCGVLIESPEIYPSLSAREALSMFSEIKGIPKPERRKAVEDAVDIVGMIEWVDKRFGSYSKGMKQRINIAAALLGDPSILLLDEPTSGLDPRGMNEVREIVKSLKKEQKLIFMSSHLLSEVQDVCDEVVMIDHGKLLLHDTIEKAVSRFSANGEESNAVFDAGFSRPVDVETIRSKLSQLGSISRVEKIDQRRIRVTCSGGIKMQEEIVSLLASLQMGLISFGQSSSALESTYLNLIGREVA